MVKVPSSDKVAKISVLEKVSLRQLAPEHSYGVGSRTLKGSRKLPPFKASNLWTDKPTLFFCIRRPGYGTSHDQKFSAEYLIASHV
jgi:hypothetical protein